jgi:hypothetical protein
MKTPVRGTADLAKHVGHKVTLSGNKAGNAEFKATSVQHLAASCQAGSTR